MKLFNLIKSTLHSIFKFELYQRPNAIHYLFSICRSSVFERCRSFWKSSVYQRCVQRRVVSRDSVEDSFFSRVSSKGRGSRNSRLGYRRIDNQDRDKHCALSLSFSPLSVSTNVPESRELSTRTQRGKLKLSPPFFYTAWTFWCPTMHGENVKFRTLFREQWDVCNTIQLIFRATFDTMTQETC